MLIRRASPKIILLASSAVAVTHTGDTSETVLATVSIPAGIMGLNGALRINSLWSTPGGSGNNKTCRTRLGGISGTQILATANTTQLSLGDIGRLFQNRASASSQIMRNPGTFASGGSSAAMSTASVNTAIAQDLVFTAQLASAGESITLEQYMVELILP